MLMAPECSWISGLIRYAKGVDGSYVPNAGPVAILTSVFVPIEQNDCLSFSE
jgi:hypothetical protein